MRKHTNVCKDKVRIQMFGRIRPEFQCLKGQGHNSNVWKNKIGIPMFQRKQKEFQCFEGQDQNSIFLEE